VTKTARRVPTQIGQRQSRNYIVFGILRVGRYLGQVATRVVPVARFHQYGGFRPGGVAME